MTFIELYRILDKELFIELYDPDNANEDSTKKFTGAIKVRRIPMAYADREIDMVTSKDLDNKSDHGKIPVVYLKSKEVN